MRLFSVGCIAFCMLAFLELYHTFAGLAYAGPPFVTDDPEPVELHNGELYFSAQYFKTRDGQSAALPQLEFNYGILPEVQLHVLFPLAYDRPSDGPAAYGPGDTEVGIKYRFLKETDNRPQVGIFPLVEAPTGNSQRGLGTGNTPVFLPIWMQKSWGAWTTYGGGGYWINPGTGNKNFWQVGWYGQRELTKALTVGGEIFHFTKASEDGRNRTGYNVGAIYNLTEHHHLLFSAGSDLAGDNRFTTYLGYQWTFGPPQEEEKKETH